MTRYEAIKVLEAAHAELAKPAITDKSVQKVIAASLLVIANTLIESANVGPGLQ